MTAREIQEAALRLGTAERAEIAQSLLESLDTLSPDEVEKLWLDEADRRAREWDEGLVASTPSAEVFQALKRG